jgi:hypothetical protein
LPLSPDDPARDKILKLREDGAGADEIMAAMDTYSVDAAYLVKALSPGHAKLMVAELLEHMIETHLAAGTFALSGCTVKPEPISWLTGPLSSELDG